MSDTRGLYQKYRIERTDGSSGPGRKHENCEYFILDLTHDPHAVTALERYAESVSHANPTLYDDLNDKLARLSRHRRCVPIRKRGDQEEPPCERAAVIPLGNGNWFCVEHMVDWHVRVYAVSDFIQACLARRGVKNLPPGRDLEKE